MNKFEDILKDNYPQKWWLGILTTIGAILLFLGTQTVIFGFLLIILNVPLETPTENPTFEAELQFATLIIGLGFIVPLLVVLAYRKYVQNLSILTLFSASRFRPKLVLIGVLAAIIAIAINFVFLSAFANLFNLPSKLPESIDRIGMYGLEKFLLLTAVYAFFIIFQAGFEEIFFRGFLMQHVRRTGANMILATIIVSVLFCAGHIGKTVPFSTIFTIFMMGLAFQIGTNICGGIEAAIGAHIANNFIILVIIGVLDNSGSEDPLGYLSGVIYFVAFLGAILFAKRLWPEDFPERRG